MCSVGVEGRVVVCVWRGVSVRACVHACVHACVRACMRACMRACVRACVRVCVHVSGCVQKLASYTYLCKVADFTTWKR